MVKSDLLFEIVERHPEVILRIYDTVINGVRKFQEDVAVLVVEDDEEGPIGRVLVRPLTWLQENPPPNMPPEQLKVLENGPTPGNMFALASTKADSESYKYQLSEIPKPYALEDEPRPPAIGVA